MGHSAVEKNMCVYRILIRKPHGRPKFRHERDIKIDTLAV
jgi:hypothetical protein